MKKVIVIAVIVILLAAAGIVAAFEMQKASKRENNTTNKTVHSFEECVAAGNPVAESYPRRCTAGKITFVEPITQDVPEQNTSKEPVVLEGAVANQKIASPVTLKGEALGTWFFEASFPVRLLDADGKVVASSHAEAKENWMTTDYVQFEVRLTFVPPASNSGFIEFAKDNPSGLPEHDASVRIPVVFR